MSIKEIAKRANTSISTVSRVLNSPGYQCKQKELSEKIWEIAKELNYLPNTAAQNLRRGIRSDTKEKFTVDVFLTRYDSLEQDYFFRELYQLLKEELLAQGCFLGQLLTTMDVTNFTLDATKTPESIPYRSIKQPMVETKPVLDIENKKNTGLILFGKCPPELYPALKKRYTYIVGIDRNPTEYLYDEVICNGAIAAEKALEYLISLGHRSIAYIGNCSYESRYIGYYQSLFQHKIPLNHENIHVSNQTEAEGYKIMMSILESKNRPTAIFCANDTTAMGVLKAMRKKRKRGYVPSIISIDNIEGAEYTTPPLTTITIPKQEMVHFAISLLLDRKNGNHHAPVRLELPCSLCIRESCTYVNE